MNRFLATAFCPSPSCWYRLQLLTLDAAGNCLSFESYTGETANTKVCAGLVFLVKDGLMEGFTPNQAMAWLKDERGWTPNLTSYVDPGTSCQLDASEVGWGPFVGAVWCLEGVDIQSGEVLETATLYQLQL